MNELKTMVAGNEAGFRVLFECATIGILVVNESGEIELINSCAENLFGYSQEELIGKPLEILIPQNLRHKHTHHRESYFYRPKARPMGLGLELHACKKDGVVFPVEISLGHYELDGTNMAVAFITDITERKKAEAAVLESKQKLDDEAEALKYLNEAGNRLWLIENLNKGLNEILNASIELTKADKGNVQLWDTQKKILRIATHVGFESEFLDYFREVSADDASACGQALKERKQIVVEDTEKEWGGSNAAIARKSGFRAVQSTPLFASDGSFIGMISTHFKNPGIPDKSNLKRMELYARNAESFVERIKISETIQKQNLELEDKVNERTEELMKSLEREKEMSELKSRFVSMASHEFRTPLSVILSSTSLIERYLGEGDERVMKHLLRVKSSVGTLTSILNDFLSLDKLEQGKVEIEWQSIDMNEFMKDVIEEALTIQRRGQQINTIQSGNPWIQSDHKKLRYIVINLVSNAIKYSSEDTVINLRTHVEENLITISIQDHGIGIPEEEQKHLFEKFFRAKNTGTVQGTGLGLTIVKRYVELMGGYIEFVSKVHEGTTFTIRIPQSS